MFPSRTISLVIDRPCQDVYAFLSQPETLSQWAEGPLHNSMVRVSAWVWTTRHNEKPVSLHFTPPNDFGILDVQVVGAQGLMRQLRARVFPNGAGTELCCTLFQAEGEDDARFASECEWLSIDLKVLKSLLEAR